MFVRPGEEFGEAAYEEGCFGLDAVKISVLW